MVFIYGNGEVCEDAEYYGIFHEEELEIEDYEKNEDFIDNYYNEDMIYMWEHKLMLV